MIGGGQHVDAGEVGGDGKGAHQLGAVDEDDGAHGPGDRADRRDVRPVPGRRLHAAEGDQHGAPVDPLLDVVGLEPAVAERHLPHVVALAGEQAPGEVVRAVLALADHHVLAGRRRTQLRRHQPGRGRDGRDQGDVRRVGADDRRHRDPGPLARRLALGVVQAVLDPLVDVAAIGLGQRPAGQADGRGVEVRHRTGGRVQPAGLAEVGHASSPGSSDRSTARGLQAEEVGTGVVADGVELHPGALRAGRVDLREQHPGLAAERAGDDGRRRGRRWRRCPGTSSRRGRGRAGHDRGRGGPRHRRGAPCSR